MVMGQHRAAGGHSTDPAGSRGTVSDSSTLAAIHDEFPGWYIWQGLINGLWHGRRRGDGSIVLLNDNSPRELAEQIREYEAQR